MNFYIAADHLLDHGSELLVNLVRLNRLKKILRSNL